MMIKIVCLNTWNYHEWDKRKNKMIEFFKEQDADIIVLQEINDDPRYNTPGNDIARQLNADLNYPHIVVKFNSLIDKKAKPELGDIAYRQGLAILSKYPLNNIIHYSLRQEPEDHFKRGIVLARVEVGKGIDILNVHFSNRTAWANKHWDETRTFLNKIDRRPIILGDFNFKKAELLTMALPNSYRSMYSEQQYCSYPKESETYDLALLPMEIQLKSFKCTNAEISDHRPLILTIIA